KLVDEVGRVPANARVEHRDEDPTIADGALPGAVGVKAAADGALGGAHIARGVMHERPVVPLAGVARSGRPILWILRVGAERRGGAAARYCRGSTRRERARKARPAPAPSKGASCSPSSPETRRIIGGARRADQARRVHGGRCRLDGAISLGVWNP